MHSIRIWFSKTGAVKYVSHLDMFRLMTRAVRRAGVPLWYTEGFNPHPYISFLQPLPLGVETLYEPLDIRIEGDMANDTLRDALNAVLPAGLHIEAVTEVFCKPAEAAWGKYEIVLDAADISAAEITSLLAAGGLSCEKSAKVNGKKGVKTVDVSAAVKEYAVTQEDGVVRIALTLPVTTELTLNPLQFLSALGERAGRRLQPLCARREKLLCADMSDFA